MNAKLPMPATLLMLGTLIACGGGSNAATVTSPSSLSASTPTGGTSTGSLAAIYTRFRSGVTVTGGGTTVTLQSRDVPDHPSPYWGVGNSLYEAPQAGMQVNPNLIVANTLTLRVPANPAISGMSDTPLGPIGMAVNGVALFNQYAAGRVPLTNEIFSFDRYNGHPSPTNQYHYHMEPLAITNGNRSGLVGVLLDGFSVYGPDDSGGKAPTGLDVCNGHVSPTEDAADGVYHYHTTATTPYISGCFRGSAGSVG